MRFSWHKTKQILGLIFVFPFYCLTIAVDRMLPRNPLCRIPRAMNEVTEDPRGTLFALLKRQSERSGVPRGSKFVRFVASRATDLEPDKNLSVLKGVLTYRAPGATADTDLALFVKISTARPVAVWIKAVGATLMEYQRENGFFTIISEELRALSPSKQFATRMPEVLAADWVRVFDRTILVMRVVDSSVFKPVADYQGASVPQLLAMARVAGRLHAATWGATQTPALRNNPERQGADFLDGPVSLFRGRLDADEIAVWDAIVKRLKDVPVVFSHVDFRPGNMLFGVRRDLGRVARGTTTGRNRGGAGDDVASDSEDGPKPDDVVVVPTDWEASNIAPYAWEVNYCLVCGSTPEQRRERAGLVVDEYLKQLRFSAGPKPAFEIPKREEMLRLMNIMSIGIGFFGFVLTQVGGVGTPQGNSQEDCDAWGERVNEAVIDALDPALGLAKELGVSEELFARRRVKHQEEVARMQASKKKSA